MPDRSRINPMNVKNGTQSSVSFDMTPQIRSGSACSSDVPSRPKWMPSNPNAMPTAPSEKATGKPSSSVMTSAQNISGAMLATIQSVMNAPPRSPVIRRSSRLVSDRHVRVLARHFLDQIFLCALVVSLQRIGDAAHQKCDALDELGEALQYQQEESDRHHQ